MKGDKSTHSYIGRCAGCNGIRAAVVDDTQEPKHLRRDVGKMVAEWITDGLIVERVTHDVVRAGPWKCSCPTIDQLALSLKGA